MSYFANFSCPSAPDVCYRFDTRISLTNAKSTTPIAAVIAKNPGSAGPAGPLGILSPLTLGKDKMLPTIRRVFEKAFKVAGKCPKLGDYIQVLNLFYYCSPDLDSAKRHLRGCPSCPTCLAESIRFPIVWYAWGASDPILNTESALHGILPIGSPLLL